VKKSDVMTGMRVLRDRPDINLVEFFVDTRWEPSSNTSARAISHRRSTAGDAGVDITFAIGPAGTGKTFLARVRPPR